MHQLPELSYPYDSLEPFIDKATMELHHLKHHQTYVDKLNSALSEYPEFQNLSIEELLRDIQNLPDEVRQSVINNGGGHANHSLFWRIMSPNGARKPKGDLADAIESTFGGFEEFKKQFSEKAMNVFGSGWAFLIKNPNGTISLKRHSFQNSPLMYGNTPILGLDLWEHAYYLKYQNRRGDYIAAWWNVVDWDKVSELFLEK